MSNLMSPVTFVGFCAVALTLGIFIGTRISLFTHSGKYKSILHNDRHIFYTYTPQAYQPGTITNIRDGDPLLVTRVVEVTPTGTTDGGLSRCFEVRGREYK